jgi:biopolymer transport protein ExbD
MNGAPAIVLRTPARRRRASFVLTSLIDVIFLLVIFFMVSSQVLPYSLIAIGSTASGAPVAAEDQADAAPVALRIQQGRVSIGGRAVPLADLPGTLAALRESGVSSLVISTAQSASVQDLVSVLEMTRAAAFETVTVLNRRTAAP